jgi:hypothetical protein
VTSGPSPLFGCRVAEAGPNPFAGAMPQEHVGGGRLISGLLRFVQILILYAVVHLVTSCPSARICSSSLS